MSPSMRVRARAWRGLVNQLVHDLRGVRLDDDAERESAAARVAERMLARQAFPAGPESYHWLLSRAVADEHLVGPGTLPAPAEHSLRRFCARVRDHLEAARPWPASDLVALDPEDWPWGGAAVTARLRPPPYRVQPLLGLPVDVWDVDGAPALVLVVRLRGGEVLAITYTEETGTEVRVLRGEPRAALAAFLSLVGLPPAALTPG